jgi:oxygen-independent coproporphyrinogen-3 oxidase
LGAAGYHQYEISNWARGPLDGPGGLPRHAGLHNVAYWLNAAYHAAGAGAHGHIDGQRFVDVLAVEDYINRAGMLNSPLRESTALAPTDVLGETMMMGLRLNMGISYAHILDRTGFDIRQTHSEVIAASVAEGLLDADDIGMRLTVRGRMYGNQVFQRFL